MDMDMPWEERLRQFDQIFDRYENHREILNDRDIRSGIFSRDAGIWHGIIESSESADHCMDWTDSFSRSMSLVSQAANPSNDPATVVLIGTGGASLAAKAYASAIAPTDRKLQVVDSTSPDFLGRIIDQPQTSERYHIIASKSGGTVETLDIARSFFELAGRSDNFCAVTDPVANPLRNWAKDNGIPTYPSDPFVPGRYSSLSTLGLLPLKFLGYDLRRIHSEYRKTIESVSDRRSKMSFQVNQTAAVLAALAMETGSRLVLSANLNLLPVLQWTEQIVAESLGKSGFGTLPVIEIRQTDDLPGDQLQVRMQISNSQLGSVIDGRLNDQSRVIRYFLFWQTVVSMTGYLLGINPFDQPNVELSKREVRKSLARQNFDVSMIRESGGDAIDGSARSVEAVRAVLQQITDTADRHDYIGLLAFMEPDTELFELMYRWTRKSSERTGLTAVFGFGPQYLHSTGQFHKGGPKTGHYIVIGVEGNRDIEVCGRAYTFGSLFKTQLDADAEVLRQTGRPVHRFEVRQPVTENLRTMLEQL